MGISWEMSEVNAPVYRPRMAQEKSGHPNIGLHRIETIADPKYDEQNVSYII